MRVSTGMIYDSGLSSIQNRTSSLLRVQQQLSTGRRILAPSDDPVAAARALDVQQSIAGNKAQGVTRDNAKSAVGIADAQLQSATDLLVRVRELTVQAGDAALSAQDRRSVALELRQRFDELLAIANAKDGLGNSLFAGFQIGNKPFAGSVEDGVSYIGDDGLRALQVSNARQLGINQSGNDIFMRVQNGNGVFATSTQNDKSANSKGLVYEGASSLPTADGNFEIRFWEDTDGLVPSSAGYAAGSLAPSTPINILAANNNNQFGISLDGGAITQVVIPDGPYVDASALATAMNGVLPAGATASATGDGRISIARTVSGASTSITLSNGTINNGLATMFGTPVSTQGVTQTAGAVYYDLVDASGNSLYTGGASTTGAAGTYRHVYDGSDFIPLTFAGNTAVFDYGTSLLVRGQAHSGDALEVSLTAGVAPAVTASTTNSRKANATIDTGTVADPLKWSQATNSGDLEVRFWVDVAGTVATAGQAAGSISPTLPMIVTAATADQFTINVDGVGAQTITLTPGTYNTTAAIQAEVQARINALAAPAVSATVSTDANGRLVVTSGASGGTSSVALAEGNGGLARVFGAPTATAGTAAAAGRTFYDLVDATTGNSLFTNTASTSGGAGNTYTHAYAASPTTINLSSVGGPGQVAFDFGASVAIAGIPAGDDAFTIKSGSDYTGNGYFVTAAKTATTYNTGSGIIGTGDILDEAKWNHPANSRNLEVRFWQDPEEVSDPPTVYYDLVDAETEKSLFTDSASTAGGTANTFTRVFKSGDAIPFAGLVVPYGTPSQTITNFGISVTINGTPASGDAFKVRASETQSVFETLAQTIQLLESGKPVETMGNVQFHNELGSILSSLSRAEDSILSARAVFGTGLSEVDSLDSVGENLNIQFEDTLSRLQDLDYAEAITKLTRQQMELQAAQQSFSKISQLSLFDYIR